MLRLRLHPIKESIHYEAMQSTLGVDATTVTPDADATKVKFTNTLKLNSEITALEIGYKMLEDELNKANHLSLSHFVNLHDENNYLTTTIMIGVGNNAAIQNYKKSIFIWVIDVKPIISENDFIYTFIGEYKNDTSNIGLYFNKRTNQLGLVVDNKNMGYVTTFNSKINSISLKAEGLINGFEADSKYLDKIISSEVFTVKSKFKNTFPTGTTGICGQS